MDSNLYLRDEAEEDGNEGYLLPLLPFHQILRRSRTIMDLREPNDTVDGIVSPYYSGVFHSQVAPRRSAPQMRLQVSIPASATANTEEEITPQSDSPETPASVTSPIAGVVDLTRSVTTTSRYAVAQGGLSDIYMGEWHRAVDDAGAVEKITVAIKLLRVLASKDQDGVRARQKLNREVYVWHRLEHPNVVKLFGTSYHMAGRPAMVMQWYHNGSAAEYLAHKNQNADRLQLILDIALGLEYLHTHKPPIVHADLKGNNVLITDDGRAALCDFGLSQVVEDLGRPAGLTLSDPNVGPLRWQAPELSNDDEPATLSSDVWSFGCTAFELLTSRIPYPHLTRDAQVLKDMHNGKQPSGTADVALLMFDSRARALLNSCWHFTPAKRPHMTQVRTQLEAICVSRANQPQ